MVGSSGENPPFLYEASEDVDWTSDENLEEDEVASQKPGPLCFFISTLCLGIQNGTSQVI